MLIKAKAQGARPLRAGGPAEALLPLRRIKALVASNTPLPEVPSVQAVVTFYYSPDCPYSTALRPVLECLPKFFPSTVKFVAIDSTQLPATMQLNNGVLSTPLVRISAKVQPLLAAIPRPMLL